MDLKALYREVIMDHYKRPQNKGLLDTDKYFTVHLNNPTCGDDITIQLLVEDGIIKDLRHQGIGCSICCSSASVASVTLKNKTLSEGLQIINEFYELIKGNNFNQELIDGDALAFQTVHQFPARVKCATLGWKAFEQAILVNKKELSNG